MCSKPAFNASLDVSLKCPLQGPLLVWDCSARFTEFKLRIRQPTDGRDPKRQFSGLSLSPGVVPAGERHSCLLENSLEGLKGVYIIRGVGVYCWVEVETGESSYPLPWTRDSHYRRSFLRLLLRATGGGQFRLLLPTTSEGVVQFLANISSCHDAASIVPDWV